LVASTTSERLLGSLLGAVVDIRAVHHGAQQGAEETLGVAVGVRSGGVDERSTCLDECGELVTRLVLVGVAAPGHGA
jgi:hypothetical protein